MGSTTVTVTFPASLNFVVYVWYLCYDVSEGQRPGPCVPSSLWTAPTHRAKVEQIWDEQLAAIARTGVARNDGQCLADPAHHLRALFTTGTYGDQAFHTAWLFFRYWWSQSRNAMELAAAPLLLEGTRPGPGETGDRRTVLLLLDTPPSGFRRDAGTIRVVPFEDVFRKAGS